MTNSYFDFLCHLVGRKYEYSRLLAQLHGVEFYSLVPNDDNRGADGEQLRNNYIDEVGPTGAPSLPRRGNYTDEGTCDMPQERCSVLEMLIGVANRLEFELLGGRYERPAREWFWVLIDNLGLDWCDDVAYSDRETSKEVETKITDLLERQYDTDGEGGLFPLHHAQRDQRRVEIWYQMSAWVIENYPI